MRVSLGPEVAQIEQLMALRCKGRQRCASNGIVLAESPRSGLHRALTDQALIV